MSEGRARTRVWLTAAPCTAGRDMIPRQSPFSFVSRFRDLSILQKNICSCATDAAAAAAIFLKFQTLLD